MQLNFEGKIDDNSGDLDAAVETIFLLEEV